MFDIPSDDKTKKEEFQAKIQMITEFLNDLKKIEDFLVRQWSQSITETCKLLSIQNDIVELLSKEIKCENYVPLC